MYVWLCWVFVSVRGLSLVAASGDHSSSRCAGLSLSQPLLLRSTGSRRAGSVVVAHGSSCSVACGIFPDQGLNPCPLHWQADSQPLRHQGSPTVFILFAVRMTELSPEPSVFPTFFFNDTATTEIYTLSLHDALPISGPVAPWHVGSSQTRARTRVSCIGRQILNHCATREAPTFFFKLKKFK